MGKKKPNEKIKDLRIERNKTEEEVSAALGISDEEYLNIENGVMNDIWFSGEMGKLIKTIDRRDVRDKLLEYFNINIKDLI